MHRLNGPGVALRTPSLDLIKRPCPNMLIGLFVGLEKQALFFLTKLRHTPSGPLPQLSRSSLFCIGEETEKLSEASIRPITQDDFIKAKEEVSASVHEDAYSIAELRKWNEMYGEGGSRTKSTLTYFV